MRQTFILLLFLLMAAHLEAQTAPKNDECVNATKLASVEGYCSVSGEYSNIGSTVSSQTNGACLPSTTSGGDVWFSFDAIAKDVNISIIGNLPINSGGTMKNPQYALYSGTCGKLKEIGCISDLGNRNTVQAFASSLTVGDTYYIRISSRSGSNGTFQLCVNNFNSQPNLSGDCSTANILCDKKAITVPLVNGRGKNPAEIGGICTGPNCGLSEEDQSSWFKWTCQKSGTLTFDINPLNPDDDIDFVLYELPNGINNCNGKANIRCEFAGEITNAPLSQWKPCTGATGLKIGQTDDTEFCGCNPGYNNYVAPVDMVAGKAYALVINNFSQSGSGYTLSFGGTGTFVGPQADFNFDPTQACVGQVVSITDASTFSGGINSWSWSFGPTAATTSSIAQGPHKIQYKIPGQKKITLSVGTKDGCTVTQTKDINITCCVNQFAVNAKIGNETCPSAANGLIDLGITNNFAPYTFAWSNKQTSEDLSGLSRGQYQVTITDQSTCDTVLNYNITAPPPFKLVGQITKPTCNGGTDGAVVVQVGGATPPYQYSWRGGAFAKDTFLRNIPIGIYKLQIRDNQNCLKDTTFDVRELELILDPTVSNVTRPRCFGFSDGSIKVSIPNGKGPYQYNWNDGKGFQSNNLFGQIKAGSYKVDVRDANLCKGQFVFNVQDYPRLGFTVDQNDPSCFGTADGKVTLTGKGGNGGYKYRWGSGETTPSRSNLKAGTYPITISDANDCVLDTLATLVDPAQLFIDKIDVVNNKCYGDTTGQITVRGKGGTPPLSFSINGRPFRAGGLFTGLKAGRYTISIQDAAGCLVSKDTIIRQPSQLTVDAGIDLTINLGQNAQLRAFSSSNEVSYSWKPAEQLNLSTSQNPVANPVRTTDFEVTVTEKTGGKCSANDVVRVTVVKYRPIYAPNAFSPGSDNINSGYVLYGTPAARKIKMLRIFDRWGELVFEKPDINLGDENNGWNGMFKGKMMNPGVFVYVADVEFIDNEVISLKGEFTLVR